MISRLFTNTEIRSDQRLVAAMVTEGARVLDVGCGGGELLRWLRDEKQVDGRGIEIDQEQVNRAISSGIPVIQGDVDSDLPHYPEGSYDYVILSQTLQATRHPRLVVEHVDHRPREGVVDERVDHLLPHGLISLDLNGSLVGSVNIVEVLPQPPLEH